MKPMAAQGIDAEALGKTLKAVTNIYQTTVIDAGSELSPLALKALEFSTAIFLIVPPDILAVNQTKRLLSDLITMLFPKEMIFLLMNQGKKDTQLVLKLCLSRLAALFSMILKMIKVVFRHQIHLSL